VRDGRLLGLEALGAAVSTYLNCDCRGRVAVVVVMMGAAAADSKDQRPGAEPDSQRRNLQVCMRGGVQVQGCAGGSKTQQSRAAWS
jgi:hypothetical protein